MKTKFFYIIAVFFVILIAVTFGCVNETISNDSESLATDPEAIWEYQGKVGVIPKVMEELKSNPNIKMELEDKLLNNDVLWEDAIFLLIENKKRILVPVLSYSKKNIIAILSLERNKVGKTQWNVTFRWDLAKNNVQLPFWESRIWHGYFLALDKDLLGLGNGNPGISDKFTNVTARKTNLSKSSASTSSCIIGERCIYNYECVTYDGWETYTCTTELDYCEPIVDESCYYNDDGGDTGGTGGGDTGGGGSSNSSGTNVIAFTPDDENCDDDLGCGCGNPAPENGECLFPFFYADCKSFEYAQPPGASYKACAVTNLIGLFYAYGIQNGKTGTFEVSSLHT